MLAILLSTALFAAQQRVAFPRAARVAIAQGTIFAVAADGHGAVFVRDGKGRFGKGATFPVDHAPSAIAIADLNGDGRPDLAIANHERPYATVLLADGKGGFAKGPQALVDVRPHVHSVAVADMDGDGAPDLVFNDMAGARAVWLRGKGDGSFGAQTNLPTGARGHAYFNVAAGDLDGDGKPDLVVPNHPEGTVAVLFGGGRRTLLSTPHPAFFALIGDFDGDGRPDIAVVTYSGSIADPGGDSLVVLRGDGKGGFAAPQAYRTGPAPVRAAAADVDGDGIADLAVCQLGGGVKLLLGGPKGLRDGETVAAPHPQDVALGDLDGDGKADLAIATADGVEIHLTR